jgi:long-chain fatty acid transport protein
MRRAGWMAVLSLFCFGGQWVQAQSNDEIGTGIQFDFSTPGARSLALGGAFLGLADDATAAYANPAGLKNLTRPEVAVEGRRWNFSSRFTTAGHVPADAVTGVGVDTVRGVASGSLKDDTLGLSFLSFVFPRDRWAIAFYRHELSNYEARIESQGPFIGREDAFRVFPFRSKIELDIIHYGVSGSLDLGQKLSVGGGISYYDFSLASRTERFFRAGARQPANQPANTVPGGFYGPADFSPANLFNSQVQEGDDSDLAWSVGFLWRPRDKWSLGGVYRRGPEFNYTARFVFGPKAQAVGVARDGEVLTSNSAGVRIGGRGTFHVPDVYGLGVALFPGYRLQATLDVQRVRYSQLTDHLVNLLQNLTADQLGKFRTDDATEIHLGLEYTIFQAHPIELRLGAWSDPDHKMRFDSADPRDLLLATRFQPGHDEIHLTGGFGLYIGGGQRYKLDAAVDLSDRLDTLSLALATTF